MDGGSGLNLDAVDLGQGLGGGDERHAKRDVAAHCQAKAGLGAGAAGLLVRKHRGPRNVVELVVAGGIRGDLGVLEGHVIVEGL